MLLSSHECGLSIFRNPDWPQMLFTLRFGGPLFNPKLWFILHGFFFLSIVTLMSQTLINIMKSKVLDGIAISIIRYPGRIFILNCLFEGQIRQSHVSFLRSDFKSCRIHQLFFMEVTFIKKFIISKLRNGHI